MDGLELKILRIKADVTQIELAKVMGVSNSYVSVIEAKRTVSTDLAGRYVVALATCTTKTTAPIGAEATA